jgi:hypothetical protein
MTRIVSAQQNPADGRLKVLASFLREAVNAIVCPAGGEDSGERHNDAIVG